MLRLHTFGSVYISQLPGEPLSGAASQRRVLAILVALADAGDGGLSRDKLIGLFWADTEIERARHSLTQAIYSIRKALGHDDLFDVSTGDVRLRAEQFTSDVREFESALDRGDLDLAVSLSEGPFLDGFHVSGAPEFEQWATARRAQLRAQTASALDRLGARAEQEGDHAGAVRWRRRLAGLLPLDSATTAKLMTALANAGDRAGAIRQAEVHAALLREELDLEPDPMVATLAAELRAPAGLPADAVTRETIEGRGEDESIAIAPASPDLGTLPRTPTSVVRGPGAGQGIVGDAARVRTTRWLRLSVLSVIIVGLVATGVVLERARRNAASPAVRLPVRQRVVVAPFRVAGAAPALSYLRDGMVELLSTRLADDTVARSVDAGAVLGAWRAAGLTADVDVPRATIVDLANRLGAERVVVGSVVGSPARTVLSATVLTLPGGAVSGQASVTGSADSIFTLIDRLAVSLLASEAGQEDDVSHLVSRSLPAIRAFLAGQSAFRRDDYSRAIRSYAVALRRDSSFALAALYQAHAGDRLELEIPLRTGVAVAWASRDELSERERARLLALSGPRYPELPTSSELSRSWQRVVDLAPSSADSWYEFALRLVHDGGATGLPDARERATSALRRALAVDSTHREARALLSRVETRGDSLVVQRTRSDLSRLTIAQLRAVATATQRDLVSPDVAAHALALLSRSATEPTERLDAVLGDHSLALNRGARGRALEATGRLRRMQPATHAWLRLRVLDGLYGDGDSTAAVESARTLSDVVAGLPLSAASTSEGWLSDACVLSQWRLRHGDTSGVRSTITRLRSWDRRLISPVASAAPIACAELLEAWLSVSVHDRDALRRVVRLDSLVFTPQVAGDAYLYAPLLVAELYARLGDPRSALRRLRAGASATGWPRYRAAMARLEGELAMRLGDTTAATDVLDRYRAFLVEERRTGAE